MVAVPLPKVPHDRPQGGHVEWRAFRVGQILEPQHTDRRRWTGNGVAARRAEAEALAREKTLLVDRRFVLDMGEVALVGSKAQVADLCDRRPRLRVRPVYGLCLSRRPHDPDGLAVKMRRGQFDELDGTYEPCPLRAQRAGSNSGKLRVTDAVEDGLQPFVHACPPQLCRWPSLPVLGLLWGSGTQPEAISGRLEQPSVVLFDFRLDHVTTTVLDPGERPLLFVLAH